MSPHATQRQPAFRRRLRPVSQWRRGPRRYSQSTLATDDRPRPLLLGDRGNAEHPGGLNRYVSALHGALREYGLDSQVVVVDRAGDPLLLRLHRFRRAAAHAGRERTVVDAHFALNAWLPLLTSWLRGRPLVVHFHGPWADEGKVQGGRHRRFTAMKRLIERQVYQRTGTVVVLSTAFKELLVARYGVAPWRVQVIPPGVDLKRFKPGDRSKARAMFGVADHAAVAVTVRRLVARMGLDVLIQAWAMQRPAGGVLLIVGEGSEQSALEKQAQRLGLADSVRFLGRLDDEALVHAYQAADVVVVPTVALEGFGLTVLESLACGTPVIATEVGGLPEALAGLGADLLVPGGDPAALAGRIAGAFDGTWPLPDAPTCRRHAERFSWAEVAARHEAIYAEAGQKPSGRPRVVYLDHCALLSGGELALLRMLPAMRQVEAHVILAQDGPLRDRLLAAGVSVEVLPMGETARDLNRSRVTVGRVPILAAVASLAYVVRLTRRLRQLRPDIVHTNSLKSSIYGGVAGRLAGTPVVWHVRDRIAEDYMPESAVRLVKALARVLPSAVIGNSRSTLDTLGPTRAPQAVISSPVSMPVDASRSDRDGEGSDHRPFRVGIVGRLAPWKGQHFFLEAFARAFPGPGVEAVVVGAPLFGESEYEQGLRAQSVALGIGDRVDFRGFRTDVASELARLDVVVHASLTPEPFGQVVVEAMALGLPVVAADAGGPAEIVDDGRSGVLYPIGDAAALAAALRRLADDADLRTALGCVARERARQFRPEVIAGLVESFYRPIVAAAR